MIRLPDNIHLAKKTSKKLAQWQKQVDDKPSFAKQSAEAKRLFPQHNKKGNKTFDSVKELLSMMCNNSRRCVYCEDSLADEVEHIYPKDLYPKRCFVWENYVYACGPCNGPKNNKFAVFLERTKEFTEVNPPKGTPAEEPPPGNAVLINPREEDPMEFAVLNLETFMFHPLPALSFHNKKRVEYTFDEILRLNSAEREPIRQARKNAYFLYKTVLNYYVQKKAEGASQSELDTVREGLRQQNHRTVWKEMQRYYQNGLLQNIDPEVVILFQQVPEALNW